MGESRNQAIGSNRNDHSLLQRTKQTSVVLSDLDGLLVNSENFNQVFVHRTSKAWMRSTISRVVQSELHLLKFLQVLIKFITTERHPEWARHALVWLRFLLTNYSIPKSMWPATQQTVAPLLSHSNEMAGLHDSYIRAALRGTAVERLSRLPDQSSGAKSAGKLLYNSTCGIPSTGYRFVDDSDEESTTAHRMRPTSRHSRAPTGNSVSVGDDHTTEQDRKTTEFDDDNLSLLTDDDEDEDADSEGEGPEAQQDAAWGDSDADADESDDQFEPMGVATPSDSDHGVFDVNDTASSSSHEVAGDLDECDDGGDEEDDNDEDEIDFAGDDDWSGAADPSGNAADSANSDDNSEVGETTSESDEETNLLLLGRQMAEDEDEDSEDEEEAPAVRSPAPRTPGSKSKTPTKSPASARKRARKSAS